MSRFSPLLPGALSRSRPAPLNNFLQDPRVLPSPSPRAARLSWRWRLMPLLCAVSLGGNAMAVEVIYQGPPGSSGIAGAVPGAPGTAGLDAPAAVRNYVNDTVHALRVTGGGGGAGGQGANGAAGQPPGAGGAGGAGALGSATLWANPAPGTAPLAVVGTGGAGGHAGMAGDDLLYGGDASGGAGGNAVAVGNFNTTGSAAVQANALATGGTGGDAIYGRGGDGGAASASLTGTVDGALDASFTGTANGGAGGGAFGSPFETPTWGVAGNGSDALSNVTLVGLAPATGSWNALISASSTAIGGNAGSGFASNAGGTGTANLAVAGYGRTTGYALAQGGYGSEAAAGAVANATVSSNYSAVGRAEAIGSGSTYGDGGYATATARSSSNYQARAEAVATSGSGRFGLSSPANAEANASVVRLAGTPASTDPAIVPEARARAIATGSASQARASSSYRDQAAGATVTAVAATGGATIEYGSEARSAANVGGPTYGPLMFDGAIPTQVVAYASALPDAASAATLLASAPNVAAAVAGGTVLGAGTVGAMFTPFTSSATYQMPFSSGQHLLLGLFNPFDQNDPYNAFSFSVSNGGVSLYYGSFTSPAQYATFFNDKILDLGAIHSNSLDLVLTFTLTEGIFGFNYVLGVDALAPVPEPGTWLLLLAGLALVAWHTGRRGGARTAAPPQFA